MNNDLHQYAELVRNMREAQKNYFHTRQKKFLIRSKELEKQVDTWTANIVNGVNAGSGQ